MAVTLVGRFPRLYANKEKYEHDPITFSTYEGDSHIYGVKNMTVFAFDTRVSGLSHAVKVELCPSGVGVAQNFDNFTITQGEPLQIESPEGGTKLTDSHEDLQWWKCAGDCSRYDGPWIWQLDYKGVKVERFVTINVELIRCMGHTYVIVTRWNDGADIYLFVPPKMGGTSR